MTDSKTSKDFQLLVAGYGAAGRAYAAGFRQAGAEVTAVDPFANDEVQKEAQTLGISLLNKLPGDLGSFDLVIILSPAAASLDIIRQLADRPGVCPVLDLTSSAPNAMQQASAMIGERLIDGTVLGAVGLGGLATPMVFSGTHANKAAAILREFGCCIACIDGKPGTASTLKLLRSLFMKSLEALVVETQLAAAALGQTEGLRIALADLAEVDMPELLAEMLRTHPKHAGRRTYEIEAAASLMREAGFTSFILPATSQLFSRTAAAGPGPDDSPEAALRWLNIHFNHHRERTNATA